MPQYLIDENLPYNFSLWRNDKFIHVLDLSGLKTDSEIWEYAKKNDLIIVSKEFLKLHTQGDSYSIWKR